MAEDTCTEPTWSGMGAIPVTRCEHVQNVYSWIYLALERDVGVLFEV